MAEKSSIVNHGRGKLTFTVKDDYYDNKALLLVFSYLRRFFLFLRLSVEVETNWVGSIHSFSHRAAKQRPIHHPINEPTRIPLIHLCKLFECSECPMITWLQSADL